MVGTYSTGVISNDGTDDEYAEFTLSNVVPANAEVAICTLYGYLDSGTKVNAMYDDVSLTIDYELATIDKSMAATAELGDIITITLDVVNPYAGSVTVVDELPDDLKYILGSLAAVPGPAGAVTVVGNTVETSVPTGIHTITFDVQVTEVQADPVDRTNTAEVFDPGDALDDSDSVDITLLPYKGFEKTVVIVYEEGGTIPGTVEVGELVQWDMTITLPNNFDWDITDAVLKDNLGGELGMAGDDVDNDQAGNIDDGAPGDLAAGDNTIPDGTLGIKTKGKTNKVQFEITGITVVSGGSLDFMLGIFTDLNPGKGKNAPHQEYTSPGTYELNSGATVKFTDPDTELQLSAHTYPIEVTVVE